MKIENKLKSGLRNIQKFLAEQNCMYHQKKKIRNILKLKTGLFLSKDQKHEIKEYFSGYGFQNVDTSWHEFYLSASKKYHKNYIPEDIFFAKIEPALNRMKMAPGLLDKNELSSLFSDIKQPDTIIKRMNGFYYSGAGTLIDSVEAISILSLFNQFVIKPTSISESGEGNNVQLYTCNSGGSLQVKNTLEAVFKKYGENFIIQKKVRQHDQMALLNESSLNTIRILSYLKNREAHILSSVVRIGRTGKFVDNTSAGGISCGIKSNGRLNDLGYDAKGNQFYKTDSTCLLKDFQIPFFNELQEAAKKLHKKMPFFKLISWDLAIDDTGAIVLIEYNTFWQEINFHQINNGPLFGGFTDEILKETKKNAAMAKLVQIN